VKARRETPFKARAWVELWSNQTEPELNRKRRADNEVPRRRCHVILMGIKKTRIYRGF
jgi:hypothetical protein